MTPLTLNFGQFAFVDFELFEGHVIGSRADDEGPRNDNAAF
jgi:hypothetical protein